MALAIGVDVGGTKVAAGVVDEDGSILEVLRGPTPDTEAPAVADAVVDLVERCSAAIPAVETVGIGAAGWIDRSRSRVYFAPNVVWRDEPIRDDLAARIDLPIVVENDGNATAWAEHRFGAGRGSPDLICVTIGTGIGGGMVASRRAVPRRLRDRRRVRPHAARARRPPLRMRAARLLGAVLQRQGAGPRSPRDRRQPIRCGAAGCWNWPAATPTRSPARSSPQAAEEGDPAAVEAFATVGEWLGRGLANVAAALDPGLVRDRRRRFRTRGTCCSGRPASRTGAGSPGADSGRRPSW